MSVGLKNSNIEIFRRRNHPNDELRLYKLSSDGQSLALVTIVEKGFFIGRNQDTMPGAVEYFLTVDTIHTDGLTEEKLFSILYAEIINKTTGQKRRYRFNTDVPPISDEYRYVIGLHAAFSDKRTAV